VQNFFCSCFKSLQFGFVIFWQKSIGKRAACKLLAKLTIEVQTNLNGETLTNGENIDRFKSMGKFVSCTLLALFSFLLPIDRGKTATLFLLEQNSNTILVVVVVKVD